MSYQVLARKWRPRDFASLVGQEHVVRALRHALENNRLHHAYLLTGTRGVGKTTIARILAKCLNCENGVSATPCGSCGACREIDGGRFVDLLEVDAATNTRVDEMRQLLDTAQYAPTRGRYKVYVIDEVHMLSNSAFNAMLKTLEEPPEHLKFILATTDPQKIPVTVLSRCLQFNLKQMPQAAIAAHLRKLLDTEGIPCEEDALSLIGRAASGSMRDALSLLDQAIAHGAGRVGLESVRDMLGTIDQTYLLRLLDAVARSDTPGAIAVAQEMLARSLSFDMALGDLARLLLDVALAQAAPEPVDPGRPDAEGIAALAAAIDPERVQLLYQIALQGRDDLVRAPDEYSGFAMTLLRMIAFQPEGTEAPAASGPGSGTAAAPRPAARRTVAAGAAPPDDWASLVAGLPVAGAARELARNAELVGTTNGVYDLQVPKGMAHLAGKSYVDKLKAALEQRLGAPVSLRVAVGQARGNSVAAREATERDARQADATRAVQEDRFVRDLVSVFDGRVVDETIKPEQKDS